MPVEFNNARHERYEDNEKNRDREVLFYDRHVSEEITAADKSSHPKDSSRDIIRKKPEIVHPSETRYKGRERADYRHKSCKNDGFDPVFFVKHMGFNQVFFFKKMSLFFMKYFWPDEISDPIIEVIADNCRRDKNSKQPVDL